MKPSHKAPQVLIGTIRYDEVRRGTPRYASPKSDGPEIRRCCTHVTVSPPYGSSPRERNDRSQSGFQKIPDLGYKESESEVFFHIFEMSAPNKLTQLEAQIAALQLQKAEAERAEQEAEKERAEAAERAKVEAAEKEKAEAAEREKVEAEKTRRRAEKAEKAMRRMVEERTRKEQEESDVVEVEAPKSQALKGKAKEKRKRCVIIDSDLAELTRSWSRDETCAPCLKSGAECTWPEAKSSKAWSCDPCHLKKAQCAMPGHDSGPRRKRKKDEVEGAEAMEGGKTAEGTMMALLRELVDEVRGVRH